MLQLNEDRGLADRYPRRGPMFNRERGAARMTAMRPPPSPRLHPGLRALACGATIAVGLSATACEPLAEDFDFDRQQVSVFMRSAFVHAAPSPRKLKVLAWNVKYGAARIPFWFDYWGDRVEMSYEAGAFNLEDIYRLLP